ncbi:MAG: surface glycoprotein [Faecalibacterium sp.]|nr:surface glycoprotein [Ruminococcus sp.]MCM1391467.1 surface glycoprotein [Ruminococcus sp.]MCM1485275.1 surface glycoprotein [Faecalibacterium sp.]
MKKVIAVLLSVLMIFSAFGMTCAFAADETADSKEYTVVFLDYDGRIVSADRYAEGEKIAVPENPERAATEEYKYIFRSWIGDDGEIVYRNSEIYASKDVTYTADYGEVDNAETPTFWKLVQSLFARINAIFEYISRIFTKSPKET